MDFTVQRYITLLDSLNHNRNIQSFRDFINNPFNKSIVLRHDVDLLPKNSLIFAKIQNELGIKGSYYFRIVPESWDEDIIKEIAALRHEVGYHYENMDTCNGNIDKAWDDFRYHLDTLRELVEVKTICMHGSPRSKYDNRDLWEKYDYRSVGIIGEPYYDVDFDKVFYLTDTGRRWDGWKVSVRDKVPQQEKWAREGLVYHTTDDIINALKNNSFPDTAMLTFHPQRWHDNPLLWTRELFSQNIKNTVKRLLVR
ncbi:MAG: hypothetical protein H8E61_00060 [Bacteroidetes bacterium]|nr:hypothetical protein [Bacteroidota bacterium]